MKIKKILGSNKFIIASLVIIDIIFILGITFVFNSFNKILTLCNIKNINSIYKYYLILFFILIFSIYYIYKIKYNYGEINNEEINNITSSRFATEEEIISQYPKIKINKKTDKAGIPVYYDSKGYAYIDDSCTNTLILGTTRSGKGVYFIEIMLSTYANVKYNEEKASIIVNDPKGELFKKFNKAFLNNGYEVNVFNLVRPDKSMRYNPLSQIIEYYLKGDINKSELLCRQFTFDLFNDPHAKDKYWQLASMAYCTACIFAIIEDYVKPSEAKDGYKYKLDKPISINTILSFINKKEIFNESENGEQFIDMDTYFQNKNDLATSKIAYGVARLKSGTTRDNVITTVTTKLGIFSNRGIADLTSETDIDFIDVGFGDKPKIIFMIIPDYDQSCHFIANIFISQLYFRLSEHCLITDKDKCSRRVIFLLEEWGNMPVMEDINNKLSVCLGRNIQFILVIQSYGQLGNYPKNVAETIGDNIGNIIYIKTVDEETSKKISGLLDTQHVVTNSRSGKLFGEKSFSESMEKVPLLTPWKIRNIKEGEAIIIRGMKRRDNNNNKIIAYPIYSKSMVEAYNILKYDMSRFDEIESIKSFNLEDLHYMKEDNEEIKDNIKTAKTKERQILLKEFLSEKEAKEIGILDVSILDKDVNKAIEILENRKEIEIIQEITRIITGKIKG